MRSDVVKKGVERASHRSLLHALGCSGADMDKPFIKIHIPDIETADLATSNACLPEQLQDASIPEVRCGIYYAFDLVPTEVELTFFLG